jgi:nitrate reductase molybdenum cofactor assembly chaperone
MRTATLKSTPSEQELSTAWQVASLLLGYPDQELLDRRPLLRRAIGTLPGPVAEAYGAFLDHMDATPLQTLATDYVETFDHRKRCCLYLTYYAYGDTRKRGMALLRFKQTYAEAGLVLDEGELPDHLSVVLEFGATGHEQEARRLLLEYRAGLEMLRLALEESESPWASVLNAVSATLPPLAGRDHDAVARLIAGGPPEEEVGLAPFGDSAGGTVFLPTPRVGAPS